MLYDAFQHARDRLAGATYRRTLDHFVTSFGDDAPVTRLVDTRELSFVCISNPDGYGARSLPATGCGADMADNDGDGVRGELGDGVDPVRRLRPPTRSSTTRARRATRPPRSYRGPGPDSDRDRGDQAAVGPGRLHVRNDHTAAELLLWPMGFRKFTPAPDDAIFETLAGRPQPAISDVEESFDGDLSSELYITNGDTLGDAYRRRGILGSPPRAPRSRVPDVTGFSSPTTSRRYKRSSCAT